MTIRNFLKVFYFLLSLSLLSCHSGSYHQVPVNDNPAFYANTVFHGEENSRAPKFTALREKYRLDTILHGEKDELKSILLLRNWIHKHIPIDNDGPYFGDGSAEGILDGGLSGHGYHCGHFMLVQDAVLNSFGYVTRCLGAAPGNKDGINNHHGINEVWLNGFHKWFLSDAKYDHHFEKNAVPLSALEIRDEYLKNQAADIQMMGGPERKELAYDSIQQHSKADFARTFTWVEFFRSNNKYTDWPKDSAVMVMYADPYFKNHTWYWDGKPHWAYNTPFMVQVGERHAVEWTPNTIASVVKIDGDSASVRLETNTPNFKTYQMKGGAATEWKDISSPVHIDLSGDSNEFLFRTLNAESIAGAPHRVLISR